MASSSIRTRSSSRISREWSDLDNDLLVSIFSMLSIIDKIVGVSSVCSSWHATAKDRHCWQLDVLDLSDWESFAARVHVPVNFNQVFNRILAFVSDDDAKLIKKIYFPPVANGQDLILVANRLPNLLYFSLPNPDALGTEVCLALSKFTSLRGVAINLLFISQDMIRYLAKFPNFSELKLFNEDEPLSNNTFLNICKFLPKLRKLEMPNVLENVASPIYILEGLKNLEYLDISGYKWAEKVDDMGNYLHHRVLGIAVCNLKDRGVYVVV